MRSLGGASSTGTVHPAARLGGQTATAADIAPGRAAGGHGANRREDSPLFPFELTKGQEKAIAEIAADMASTRPMNRLLQGDVGSGKTIVAAYAMLLAVAHGSQAVMMAPTEILARQHALTLKRMLAASEVRLVELVGGLSAASAAEFLSRSSKERSTSWSARRR